MKKRIHYKKLGAVELSEKEDKRVTEIIELSEKELKDTRVSFRWGQYQLAIVRHAANLMGVPYQTFLKLTVYERALAVLKDARMIANKKG